MTESLTAKDLTKFAYGVAKGMEFIISKGVGGNGCLDVYFSCCLCFYLSMCLGFWMALCVWVTRCLGV